MTHTKYFFSLVLLTALTSACSTWTPWRTAPATEGNTAQSPDYSLIAANLVDTLGKLEAVNQLTTTFQMVPPTTPFGIAVFKTIEDRGYGIQLVTGDLGADFLRYKAEHSQTENGILKAYSLSVGDNSVERQYAVFDGLTAPISPLTLRSNEAVEFEIDDSLFSVALDPGVSSLIRIANGVPEVIVHDDSHQHGSIFELPAGYEGNVFDLQHSNYANQFNGYYDLERQTLVFPNDSLVLGKENKIKLQKLAERVNAETDIISVIGCSHGTTAIKNGNQILAEGRTLRVTESLMFTGLNPDLILDEACWAGVHWDEVMPRRGVIVTHKRRINEG